MMSETPKTAGARIGHVLEDLTGAAESPRHSTLSGETMIITPDPDKTTHVMAPEDLGKPWSLQEYKKGHGPVALGMMPAGWNAPGLPCVLDACIKLPGGQIHLPVEVARIAGLVELVAGFATAKDATFGEAYMYVTTDQRYVEAGLTQRVGGFHADGIRGARHKTLFPVCYAAVAADRAPTEFAAHPLDLTDLDTARHNLFKAMDERADRSLVVSARENEIALMTAHCVHASPVVKTSGWRTFVRVEVSHKRFDRLGNTRNQKLNGDWAWVERPIPPHLV